MGAREDIAKALIAAASKPAVKPAPAMRIFHSSPFDFEQFSMDKLRTGEGANMFTAGIYGAQNPAVSGRGGHYWGQFLKKFPEDERAAASALRNAEFDRARALQTLEVEQGRIRDAAKYRPAEYDIPKNSPWHPAEIDRLQKQIDLLRSDKIVGPRTYEVNVTRPMQDFLPWERDVGDLPLWQKRALGNYQFHESEPVGPLVRRAQLDPEFAGELLGSKRPLNEVELSKRLAQRDIPGMSYPDAGSRPRPGAGFIDPATATRNIVGYDPQWLEIDKKYAVPFAGVGAGGMSALAAQNEFREAQ